MTEKKATREAYGEALADVGGRLESVVVLDADLSTSTKTSVFARRFPERFFNIGSAEQNLIGVASGLALSGKVAFASTYALFGSGRAWEQIRNTVARDNLNVKICVSHAGLSNASDGSSHQSLEDIAIMRAIPNMNVVVPADYIETWRVIETISEIDGPFYVRLSKTPTPVVFREDYEFSLGRATLMKEGSDLTIIACGTMLQEALDAARILEEDRIKARVFNMSTIKPIDTEAIIRAARDTGAIVTAEEHSIIGGLGSAVSEVVSGEYPVPVARIGVPDVFGQSGSFDELFGFFGLRSEDIADAARKVLGNR